MTKTATRPTIGQALNRTGDVFYREWAILAIDGPTITLGQDSGYTETLTLPELAADIITPPAPTYSIDTDGVLWQSTLDGRHRKWQANDRAWGFVEDADWVAEQLTLTPLA